MKLYLDENLSPKFRQLLKGAQLNVFTFQYMGWQGKKNGELISLLKEHNFDGVITSDKLMYSDDQLRSKGLHFFLIQSALDTPEARIPLFILLNEFLSESSALFDNVHSSKVIISDGVVNKELPLGVHVLWLNG